MGSSREKLENLSILLSIINSLDSLISTRQKNFISKNLYEKSIINPNIKLKKRN
jgi:hypothetical protein